MTSPKIFDKFWLVFRYAMPMQMHSNVRDGYYRICRALINLVPYLSSRNVRTPRIAHTTPSASDQMRWGGNQGSFVKGLCVDEDIYYLLQKYFNAENIKLFVNNHFLNPSSVVHSWSAELRTLYSFCAYSGGSFLLPRMSGIRPQLIFREPWVKTW